MEINGVEYLRREELIYWVDKDFVQEIAKNRIGRELNEAEMAHFTESMEWGLWESVFEVTKIAIDLATDRF
jgi:hypothetical protein